MVDSGSNPSRNPDSNSGSYLNPGYAAFEESITGTEYVDKTMLLAITNKWMHSAKKLVLVSRPRRFGKTMAADMLAAYYSKGCDSEHIFANRKIGTTDSFREHLNKHDVIYIDIGGEYYNIDDEEKPNFVRILNNKLLNEMKSAFPDVSFGEKDLLGEAVRKVYITKGLRFIIILDEYDVPVRENVSLNLLNSYLNFLNGLFKSKAVLPAISLAYLTGILPIIKDKLQSKLNNFKPQYTFLDSLELTPFIGFTSNETIALCEKYGMDFDECHRWYNGYKQNGIEIYNPESVILAMTSGSFANYWSETSTFQVISDRLSANFDGMKDDVVSMLAGGSVSVKTRSFLNTISDFRNKDNVFTYLIHLGYLAYDNENKTCRIPNKEILDEWVDAIESNHDYAETNSIIAESRRLLEDTLEGNEKAVEKALDKSHIHVTSNRSYNNEDGLQCAIYLAYIYALNFYTVIREMTAGKGFADMVYIPVKSNYPAMIIELKRGQGTEGAISQIESKQYFESLKHYQGNLLFIGINYDEKTKTHSCKIEKLANKSSE